MCDNIKLNNRKAITLIQEDSALTFLKPYSEELIDHLFVVYEDAYGDTVSGLLHKNTIHEKYSLKNDMILKIFKNLN